MTFDPWQGSPGHLGRRQFLHALEGTVAGAIFLTVATACSSNPPAASATPAATTTATTAAATTAAAQPAATTAPANGPAIPIEIRFNGIDTNGEKVAEKWAADFGPKHNLKITTDFVDWGSSFQKITTGIAGGIAPDIFGAGGIWVPVIVSKGGAHALDSYIADYKDWSDYYPSTKKDVTWDGKVYAVPYEVDIHQTIAYRASMFQK